MEKYTVTDVISIVLQLVEILVGLTGTIVFKNYLFAMTMLFVPLTAIGFTWLRYRRLREYILFIEFLNDNPSHIFRTLPLLRMYIHKHKRINNVYIPRANVYYDIRPCKDERYDKDNNLLGDCSIEYEFCVHNNRLPKNFYFMVANDYSNNNSKIECRIGTQGNQCVIDSKSMDVHPNWGGRMNLVSISLDNSLIPQSKEFTIYIRVETKKMFVFRKDSRDTIICLPLQYGRTIDQVNFRIDVSKFNIHPFYCNAKRIYIERKNPIIDETICVPHEDRTIFTATYCPVKNTENALFFRIGLSEVDPDDKVM